MARKKAVEPEVIAEVVDVSAVVPEIEEAGETDDLIWVEAVDFEHGRHMIQVPKEG